MHVFADPATADTLTSVDAVLHRWSPDGTTAGSPYEPRNPWLRWIRRELRDVTLDAVHFLTHGMRLGTDGAMLTPGVPDQDSSPAAPIQSGELMSFLTQVGALVVGFTRAPENPSDSGLRRLVDDLGATRAGPVVLHEPADDDMAELRECYRFLTAPEPTVPPASPHLMLYAQSRQVADLADTMSGLESITTTSPAVQRQLEREDTPVVTGALVDRAERWGSKGASLSRQQTLVPEEFDETDWRHPQVGWGVVLADRDDLSAADKAAGVDAPEPIRRLLAARTGAPVLRYRPDLNDEKLARYFPDGSRQDPAIGLSDFGVARGRLPRYLLIVGSPTEVPWRLQFSLNRRHQVGRLDLPRGSRELRCRTAVRLARHDELYRARRGLEHQRRRDHRRDGSNRCRLHRHSDAR